MCQIAQFKCLNISIFHFTNSQIGKLPPLILKYYFLNCKKFPSPNHLLQNTFQNMCFLRFVPSYYHLYYRNHVSIIFPGLSRLQTCLALPPRIHVTSRFYHFPPPQKHQNTQIFVFEHIFIKILQITGASAQRSLAPGQACSMCQNASLDLRSCSPGLTSFRLLLKTFTFHLLHRISQLALSASSSSSPLFSRATQLWRMPLRASTLSRINTSSRLIFYRWAKSPPPSFKKISPQKMGVGMRAAVRSQINLVMKRVDTWSSWKAFGTQSTQSSGSRMELRSWRIQTLWACSRLQSTLQR